MTETELSVQIKKGGISGIYFFYGEEDYLKNHLAREMKKAVTGGDETMEAWNAVELVFGSGELDLGALDDAVLAPPMMSTQKSVTVTFSDLDSLKEKDRNALLEALRSYREEAPDTVLVLKAVSSGFDEGTQKKPSAFLKQISETATPVSFPFQSDAKLTRWMERHAEKEGLTLEPAASEMLLRLSGRGMYTLSNEVEKAVAYAAWHGRHTVTAKDVAETAVKNDEDDAYRLANCLMSGDRAGALSCVGVRKRRREDPVYLLSQVTRVMNDLSSAAAFAAEGRNKEDFARSMRMNDYRAGLYYRSASKRPISWFAREMEICLEADRAVKRGGGYEAVEQLVCRSA